MPIVTGSDSLAPKIINGGFSNSQMNSLEDEESFVVLERLTANDPGPMDMSIQSLNTIQPFSNSCSFPAFNHLSTSGSASNSNNIHQFEVPGEPLGPRFDSNNISVSAEDIQKQLQQVLRENVNLKENLFQTNLAMKQHMSTVRLLQDRASEVQKNHQAKFEETKALILQLGSEKNELQEANSLLSGELMKAKQEIKEVKESNLAFGNEMAKILSENESLKKQLTSIQENMQTLTENTKKPSSLQPTAKELELHELADQLTRKLEGVERSRRQQEFDIDRLKAQLGRALQELNDTQRKLAQAENSLQAEKGRASDQVKSGNCSFNYQEKLVTYNELLNQLKITAQEEQIRCDSLGSWLAMDPIQFEISELRRLLAEEQSQSVARKKALALAISTMHDLLSDFKKIGEEIDLLKADRVVKESHSLAYDEIQKKGFTERLDTLTAKLVEKEEKLAISERHLASLEEALRLQNVEKKDSSESLKDQLQGLSDQLMVKEEELEANNKEIGLLKSEVERLKGLAESVTAFEEQAKIFKDDFEEERKLRESAVAEKERLLEDFRHLELRNQKLIDDLSKFQNGGTNQHSPTAPPENVNNRQERSLSPAPPRLNSELEQTTIFHEKQQGNLCAQHCLNALLQGAHFNAVDLAELAEEMDFAEKTKLAEAGTNSKDYKKFLAKPSENMDDTGYFSVQVIGCALDLWGLEMVPFNSTEPRVISVRNNPTEAKAFICNTHLHWFTIRRLGKQWFNLNSTLDKPEFIRSDHLDDYLKQLQNEENSIFIVFGDLPPCPAEKSGELINSCVSRISRKRKFTSKEDNQPKMKFHLSLSQNSIQAYSPQDFFKWLLFFKGQFTNSLYFRIGCSLFQNNKIFKPRQRQFFCPNSDCRQAFDNFEDVHEHVIECWGLQD